MTAEADTSNMVPLTTPVSGSSGASSGTATAQTTKPEPPPASHAPFPPPKTDKPRPHVCGTCQRSFARLEHLKRHERSHTKEKPFECPACTRCFARRDLLLRHQQKLHQQGATTARPRTGRRESTTGLPPNSANRVRKNSVASSVGGPSAGASMRPRANTISHIDPGALNNLLASHNASLGRGSGIHSGHSHHASLSGLGGPGAFDFRGMSSAVGSHGQHHGLPKLDTHLGFGIGGGLRTAPIPGFGPDEFELEKFFGTGSTINPNQLHHFNAGLGQVQSPFSAFGNPFANSNAIEEDDFAWSATLDHSLMFSGPNEVAVDGSSPSAISTASQSGFSEVMADGSGQPTSAAMWHNPLITHTNLSTAAYSLDAMAPVFPELMMNNTISPKDLADQGAADFYISSPHPITTMSPAPGIPGMPNQYFQPPMAFHSDTGSISSSSINGSARHSSVTSVSTDTLTDATRQALVYNLSQAMGCGIPQRKFSQPQISSPLSVSSSSKPMNQVASLPSTMDLQRYVSAYVQYFHPHLPFLHVPTLSFDTPAYTYHLRSSGNFNHDSMVGGGGCLILAMSAIGALYEFEHNVARELSEAARKMILYYLDERRKAGLSAAVKGASAPGDSVNKPPLWLIQAMLLNLIFGHNCGDRKAAEAASTHCAALVSLAKAAGLDRPANENMASQSPPNSTSGGDVEMNEASMTPEFSQNGSQPGNLDEYSQWKRWKQTEERKRTYFAIFSMSSILVSAYAHAPRILNSEIDLDLPCEEDLWSVDNPQSWVAMGGAMIAQSKGLKFKDAMTYLLEASTRQQTERTQSSYPQPFGGDAGAGLGPESEIRPSTFGCYVLINSLHVYIWETRQRHTGRLWKSHETEAMHAQVEPALKAWQLAWRANPNHSIERPSPFGPLSADCIPLLDLAYVRLFVNLSRSKELLWQRDFEGMASELAKGIDIVAHVDGSPDGLSESVESKPNAASNSPGAMPQHQDAIGGVSPGHGINAIQPSSKRERHLRKAAFYAADSLSMADRLGSTYADVTARELPNSSAMCTFDCAQILAEWVATVQDRVGRFLGILGKDDIDFSTVPAIMLLEEEDTKLIQKIADILHTADMKLAYDITSNSVPMISSLSNLGHCGYGTKLLMITAYMLGKSAVWPVTHVMAQALESHAHQIDQRAEISVTGL